VPPPVIFPTPTPTILTNLTDVNVWNAGDWPGRAALPVRALCLHVMAGSYTGSINWFHNPAAQASANYCVSYEGEITMTVDPDAQAPWANGISNAANTALPPGLADLASGWPNANWVTVSIETEGHDPFEDGYPRYPAQYDAVVSLMAYLYNRYNLHPSTDTLCRHTFFDTLNRPNCPGPHWDFDKTIGDVIAAMNIPTPLPDPMSKLGVLSADGQYRSFNFLPGAPVLGHAMLGYWQKTGVVSGITRYGYPLLSETTETRDDGTQVVASWCERSRLEWHPEHQGTEFEIQEGLIGEEVLAWWNRDQQKKNHTDYAPIAGPERTTLPIDPQMQAYYDQNGGLAHWGYPLTPTIKAPDSDLMVQWFERGAIELHPESATWPCQGRRVGAEWLALRAKATAAGDSNLPIVSH
jgi:hypothetical protein